MMILTTVDRHASIRGQGFPWPIGWPCWRIANETSTCIRTVYLCTITADSLLLEATPVFVLRWNGGSMKSSCLHCSPKNTRRRREWTSTSEHDTELSRAQHLVCQDLIHQTDVLHNTSNTVMLTITTLIIIVCCNRVVIRHYSLHSLLCEGLFLNKTQCVH